MFDHNGIAWLQAASRDLVVLSDGRLLLLGSSSMVRLLPDGSVDPSFSFQPIPGGLDPVWFSSIVQGPRGDLWVTGSAGMAHDYDLLLGRYSPDGAVMGRFGASGTGWVRIDVPLWQSSSGAHIVVQPDGKVLVGGYASGLEGYRWVVARFTSDGKLDPLFGKNGLVLVEARWLGLESLTLHGDKILIVGGERDAVRFERFDASGAPDRTFGTGGQVLTTIPEPGIQEVHGVQVLSDGSTYAFGRTLAVSEQDSAFLMRLRADGSVDAGFGNAGVVSFSLYRTTVIGQVLVQEDGKVLVAGRSSGWIGFALGSRSDLVLWRLNQDGTPDPTFGTGGRSIVDLGEPDSLGRVVLWEGGILVLGDIGGGSVLLKLDKDGQRPPMDCIKGSDADDSVTGTALTECIATFGGNDTIYGGGGHDRIDGGDGIDLAVFQGTLSSYWITVTADAVMVASKFIYDSDGTDTLVNVERARFSDVWVAFDISGNAGQAYRLYQAAFDRKPDAGGLGFHITALDAGFSLREVAQNFIDSPEFARTYGALNDSQFVTQLYSNVLHRAPDAGGFAYHMERLAHGATRAEILVGFSESPENQAALVGSIQNGIVYTL
jgi:uncharacterized delta-60 repeat protein